MLNDLSKTRVNFKGKRTFILLCNTDYFIKFERDHSAVILNNNYDVDG